MHFIYDCNNQIVGNPKGYRTFRGADQQAHSTKTKVYGVLWSRYYAKRKEKPDWCLVCRINEEGEQW
jgi:hypothetical protein